MPPTQQSTRLTECPIGERGICFSRVENTPVEGQNKLQIYRGVMMVSLRLTWEQLVFLLVVWFHVAKILPGFVAYDRECLTYPDMLLYFTDAMRLPLSLASIARRNDQGKWMPSATSLAAAADRIRLAHDGRGPSNVEMAYLMQGLNNMEYYFEAADGFTTMPEARGMWDSDPTGLLRVIKGLSNKLAEDVGEWKGATTVFSETQRGGSDDATWGKLLDKPIV